MIKIYTTINDFCDYREKIKSSSIGIVPTMGNLHQGHISLLKQSIEENEISIITIFVNPKQFGPNEDFAKYPRTLDDDISKISELALHNSNKEIIIFAPKTNEEIYPTGFASVISVKGVTQKLEGKFRPDHFDGVTTVVYQLFKIINPTNAYFGQKDYQQCVVIDKMIQDLRLNIKLTILPIIRNSEGLALSSRNQFLSAEERVTSLHLSKTLKHIEGLIKTHQDYHHFIANELNDKKWDYLEALDAKNLETPAKETASVVIVGAYRLGAIRLLDNILVNTL